MRFNGNRLIFEYEHPEDIGCEEGEKVTVKFEMYNGNPYIEMNGSVVSHIGYTLNAGPDEQYQIILGELSCVSGRSTNNSPATGDPTISGMAQVDETLTADTSNIRDANGLTNVRYVHQWLRVDDMTETPISGADERTYMVSSADARKQLKVRVNFTDDDNHPESRTSDPTATVNSPATGVPTILGTPQEGQRLTADTSDIMDADGLHGVTYSYQWIRVDDMTETPISGADEQTYMVTSADVGKKLKVQVTFTDAASNAEELTSEPTEIVTEDTGGDGGDGGPNIGGGGGGSNTGRRSNTGGRTEQETARPVGELETPSPDSFQSGISVICGWVCEADEVLIEINGQVWQASYGTERADTRERCGDSNNGFGLLFNWNLLGDGTHTLVVRADGEEFGRATVTVTTLGEEFVRGVMGETVDMDFPAEGTDARLVWEQSLQNFMLAPPGKFLENPRPRSFQSGIGVISGWVCEADEVVIEIDGQAWPAAYGTARADTAEVCGDSNNGFGLLFNWNLLGDGTHTIRALADGVEFRQATFTVTTLGEEFVRGVMGEAEVMDFPDGGTDARLVWEQSLQNFMLAPPEGSPAARPAEQPDPRKFLENPRQSSFQSGIGLISGWVCEADEVVIEIDGQAWPAAYGTARADTAEVCGDSNNGFGLLFNWNLLGDDSHTIRALADGAEFGQVTFTITTLGEEFVQRVMGEAEIMDFPEEETDARLLWQEGAQNFMIAPWVQDLEKQ